MTIRLSKLTADADGRYFTAEERQTVLAYAESLPRRFEAVGEVEGKEDEVVRAALEEMQQRYPNFAKYHDQAWARQFRDAQLVLRAAAGALVLDDVGQLDDRLLYWLRTMFAANNLTPAFVRDCFTLLRDQARAQLSQDTFGLLQPYLDRTVEVLGDFPEPATPAV